MQFGEKLLLLRKHHDMTQETLAERLKTSRATVSRWEAGQSIPDMRQILDMSEVFCVSVDYLMDESTEQAELGQISDFYTMRTLFIICTAINTFGFVVSLLGWKDIQRFVPLVLGIVLNLAACVDFEIFQPRGVDKTLVRYSRRQFYAANVWVLLPTPLYISACLLSSSLHAAVLPYIAAGVIYVAAATTTTHIALARYRR